MFLPAAATGSTEISLGLRPCCQRATAA